MGSFEARNPRPTIKGALGSFVYGPLSAFFSRGDLSSNLPRGDFQKNKLKYKKNSFQDPAAAGPWPGSREKIKLLKRINIKKTIVLINKVALELKKNIFVLDIKSSINKICLVGGEQ